jgi:formate/nitrite transporter
MGHRILVIDDEKIVSESLRKTLAQRDFEIDTAQSGREGLEKVKKKPFDLMLVDLKMPDANGLDLIQQIKEEQPEAVVVMITGYPEVGTATQALKTGAFDYIPKPFTPEEISSVVEKALIAKVRREKDLQTREALKSIAVQLHPGSFDARPPDAVAENIAQKFGVGKTSASGFNLLLLSILAGAYIGFGAALATMVTHDAAKFVGFGIKQLIGGAVFSLGLMLVVIAGAELFTGNNLIMASVLGGHAKMTKLVRNWIIVYLGNFIGSLLLVAMIYWGGVWKFDNMGVGIAALQVAALKVNLPFWPALIKAIGCNWLVCLAILMAISSRDVTGKILGIFFPIMAFVALGFEHSVANMYFIPLGMLLKGATVAAHAGIDSAQLANLNWAGLLHNLVPVTIGNIIGGSGFVASVYWSVYQRKAKPVVAA